MQHVIKLQKQFAHPSAKSLKLLLSNAQCLDKDIEQIIDEVSDKCDTSKRFKKTLSRPVASLPLVARFNQVLAMDLSVSFLNSVYFLHLIDMYSRFSLSKVIHIWQKKTKNIFTDAVIKMWIGTGLGSPEKNSFLQWREILQQRIWWNVSTF